MNRSRLVGSRFSRLLASQPLELVPPVVLAALRAELQTLISVEAQAFSAYDAFWTFSHTSILRDRNTSWHSIFTPSNLRVLKKTERCALKYVGGQGGWTGGTRTEPRCERLQQHSRAKPMPALLRLRTHIYTQRSNSLTRARRDGYSPRRRPRHTHTSSSHHPSVIRLNYFVARG